MDAGIDQKYLYHTFSISNPSVISIIYRLAKKPMQKIVGKKHYKQYTLKQILGTGSFGKVYHSPPYAVKQMNFQGMSAFLVNSLKNQIAILNKINHPNVVRLVDFFYEGTCVYLVLQYCEQDLSKFLKKNKCNEKMALTIFKQLVLGFRELVNQGIIHRDLKPANILVNSKGEFKLADFGFAKFVDQYDSKLLYSIVGTPLYMSPQILNKTEYTTKSDIWSLGFILYEMLTGTYPWMGVSESDLYKNITTRPLKIPSNVSTFSKDLLQRMLKINEKQRIGWEELFSIVLANGNCSPEKPRPQTSRDVRVEPVENKENGRSSPEKKRIFQAKTPGKEERKEQRAKSAKKPEGQTRENIVVMEKQNKEKEKILSKMVGQDVVREIFISEIERLNGEQDSKKILPKKYNAMSARQIDIFEKTLLNFNDEFQKAVRTIFIGGFK